MTPEQLKEIVTEAYDRGSQDAIDSLKCIVIDYHNNLMEIFDKFGAIGNRPGGQ